MKSETGWFGLGCVGILLFVNGASLRIRGQSETTIDYVVVANLAIALVGLIEGFVVYRVSWGLNRAEVYALAYLIVAAISGVFSVSHKVVLGYWVLLAGTIVLVAAITRQLAGIENLIVFEKIWVVVVTGALVTNYHNSQRFLETSGREVVRLGLGGTSPAFMGMHALILLLLISVGRSYWSRYLVLIMSLFSLLIIIQVKTRIIFIASAVTLITLKVLQRRYLQLAVIAGIVGLLGLAATLDQRFAGYFNRGQSEETISNLAGRKEIWAAALDLVGESPMRMAFGFGYGASRFHLNWREGSPEFYASHTHNAYIEHLFTMGIPGLGIYLLMLCRNTGWRKHAQDANPLIRGLAIRAAGVTSTLAVISLTEVPIGGKVNPAMILFFFYLFALEKVRLEVGRRQAA